MGYENGQKKKEPLKLNRSTSKLEIITNYKYN